MSDISDLGTLSENTSEDSNLHDSWEYAVAFLGRETSNYDHWQIPVDGNKLLAVQSICEERPTSYERDCQWAVGDEVSFEIEKWENNLEVSFNNPFPNPDVEHPLDFSLSYARNLIPFGFSASISSSENIEGSYADTGNGWEKVEWVLDTSGFPQDEDDTRAAYIEINHNGDEGTHAMSARSSYAWDYVQFCDDGRHIVHSDTGQSTAVYQLHAVNT